MQDPIAQELTELLALASDVKSRLRQLEAAHVRRLSDGSASSEGIEISMFSRSRHHLELTLEALGRPTWGYTAAPASSLEITGFYSADIYKALKDIRSGKGTAPSGQGDVTLDGPSNAEEEGEGEPQGQSPEGAPLETTSPTVRPTTVAATHSEPEPASTVGAGPSVWVQLGVVEIHRALSAAFGDEDHFDEPADAPKPFATPEFVGNTDTLAIPELIGFFQLQRKTGILTIDARHEQFTLEYLKGELIHAGSSSSPSGERLGEILVQLGHITEAKLQRLLAGKTAAERIGDALRRGDVIPEAALAQALDAQVQRIFHRLFDLTGCRFSFREGLEGEPRARVRYNVTRLLLETARHIDERSERRAS